MHISVGFKCFHESCRGWSAIVLILFHELSIPSPFGSSIPWDLTMSMWQILTVSLCVCICWRWSFPRVFERKTVIKFTLCLSFFVRNFCEKFSSKNIFLSTTKTRFYRIFCQKIFRMFYRKKLFFKEIQNKQTWTKESLCMSKLATLR